MRKTRYFRVVLLACAVAFLTNFGLHRSAQSVWGDEPIAEVNLDAAEDAAELDVAKGKIEGRLENAFTLEQAVDLLAEHAVATEEARRPADRGKGFIELGAKRLVLLSADEASGKLAATRPRAESAGGTDLKTKDANDAANQKPFSEERIVAGDSENPKVEPGKVNWHADLAAACKASQQSSKPILLFHLLGQLDQRFT